MARQIAAIRSFNRFYTRIIGLLNDGMMQSPYSLPEARLIHEVGKSDVTTAKELVATLQMDNGQLSRIISGLVGQGLLAITPNIADRRSNNLALTRGGDEACARLNHKSDEATAELIAGLAESQRQKLVQSMKTIQDLLEPKITDKHVIFRPHQIGDLGWLIHRQAVLYNLEYGWNGEFEALIAKIYADFETAPETPPKALWIAEYDSEIAGSVFVVPVAGQLIAQLRMLYVEPWARGQGIGAKLVDQAVKFARDNGYSGITLWTQDCLTSARRVYQSAGFKLVREDKHHSFGKALNGQYWQLDFEQGQ